MQCTGNSHMRFYDVTSWSYVNLDDPQSERRSLDSSCNQLGNRFGNLIRENQFSRKIDPENSPNANRSKNMILDDRLREFDNRFRKRVFETR